jgi:hypothetical protein
VCSRKVNSLKIKSSQKSERFRRGRPAFEGQGSPAELSELFLRASKGWNDN